MLQHRSIDVDGDRETLLAFHCRINYESETPYARRMTYEEYRRKWLSTPQPESFLSHLAETMEDERTLAEILEEDEAVAGYLWVVFTDVPGYDVTIAEIMDIAVAEDYQHRGVGQGMMRYIENESRKRGADVLRSDTGIDNAPSQIFHEKQGFRPYRILYEKVLRYRKPPLDLPMEAFVDAVGDDAYKQLYARIKRLATQREGTGG